MAGGSSGDSGGSQAISLRSFTAKTRSSLDQVGSRRSADTFAGHFVLQAAEWLQKGRRRAEVQGFALVHEKIPQSVAHGLGLGVRSRVQVMVRNYNFGAAAMRAHPGLADLQQNGLARAEASTAGPARPRGCERCMKCGEKFERYDGEEYAAG